MNPFSKTLASDFCFIDGNVNALPALIFNFQTFFSKIWNFYQLFFFEFFEKFFFGKLLKIWFEKRRLKICLLEMLFSFSLRSKIHHFPFRPSFLLNLKITVLYFSNSDSAGDYMDSKFMRLSITIWQLEAQQVYFLFFDKINSRITVFFTFLNLNFDFGAIWNRSSPESKFADSPCWFQSSLNTNTSCIRTKNRQYFRFRSQAFRASGFV